MTERLISCPHCGMLHEESCETCPSTGTHIPPEHANALGFTRTVPSARSSVRKIEAAKSRPKAVPPRPASPPNASRSSHHGRKPRPPSPPGGRGLVGTTIGEKYKVLAVLGEGGMGTVFEAVNLAIERQVAVKVLHTSQLRHRDAVRRFHREARAAGSIGHPNICEVYDLGTLPDGRPYLVMEKLVGATLAEQIAKEGALPVEQVVDTLMQVLSALVAAHGKGIVHRDIKPENVFLTQRVGCAPIAKLLDFGVSKMTRLPSPTDKENEVTRTGVILGTPYYLAPEQACAERHPDARIDLYACGVVLYEALTGQRPFTADSYHALLIKILTGKPRPARQLRPSLPEAFDPILEKAMARKREERYQTAVEFQNDLQRCADTAGSGPLPQFPADSDEVPTVVAVPPSLRAPPKAAPES